MQRHTRVMLAVLATTSLIVPVHGLAAEDHHLAHRHGQAQLQVAIDGKSAELILRSPAANLLDFEHEPRTRQQLDRQQEARDWLATTPLVHGEDNECTVADSTVHQQGKAGHSDFEVTQQLTCDRRLTGTLVTPLPGRFADIEHLSVEWVSEQGQGHEELHNGENRISLGR